MMIPPVEMLWMAIAHRFPTDLLIEFREAAGDERVMRRIEVQYWRLTGKKPEWAIN